MNLNDIKTLISDGETEKLEFKKSTAQLKSAAETLCAFLNGSGGIVLIGVKDNKELVGQEISDKTKRDIASTIKQFSPMPIVDIHYVVLKKNQKKIIVLNAIADATNKPYFFNHQAYIRSESTTLAMPREHLQHILISNAKNNNHWEEGLMDDATVDDLDHDEILKTIREGVTNRRIPENFVTHNIEEALLHLKLIKYGKLKNAAIVLFAKQPDNWLPQCRLKLARFRGNNKQEMMDSRQICGNAFKLLDEALLFADRHTPISSTFPNNQLERIDKPLVPFKALREIFANAIAHKNYSVAGGSVNFAIYDDRIEIWNNGSLMPGLHYKQLKQMHESMPRNPLIANTFYYRKLFEAWGRGIELITNECTQADLAEPEFFERSGGFCILLQANVTSQKITPLKTDIETLSVRQQKLITLHFLISHI